MCLGEEEEEGPSIIEQIQVRAVVMPKGKTETEKAGDYRYQYVLVHGYGKVSIDAVLLHFFCSRTYRKYLYSIIIWK